MTTETSTTETSTTQPKRYQCRHIFADGRRCGSICLRGEQLCYYHHTTRRPAANPRARHGRRSTVALPLTDPTDRAGLQTSIGHILHLIAANDIDPRRAGLLLYGLQIAICNLPKAPATKPGAAPASPQIVEEIITHPDLGTLAPPAEFAPEQRRSFVSQLLHELRTATPTPQAQPIPQITHESELTPVLKPTILDSLNANEDTGTPNLASELWVYHGRRRPMSRRTHLTRRTFLATTAATLATSRLRAAPTAPIAEKLVYIGSGATGPTAGIHVATWSPSNGTLANLRLAMQADNAAFLATTTLSGKRILFAGHQLPDKTGALSGYQVGPTGDLQLINAITVSDFDFVHTAVDHTAQAIITASYGSGKVLSAKIAPDGHISAPVSQFQLTGHGPNASRQTSPHAHGVAIAPDNRFVLVNDLGTDRIMIYKLNPATAELTPNNPPFFQAAPGSGPRHTAFHPSGKWAYSINELDSTITQMSWNASTGVLTLVSNTPTMPAGSDTAAGRAGEVVFDKTGRFLYACNRAAIDDIVVYTVGNAGQLTLAQRLDFNGKEARHYALSPDGAYFILAEQFSDKVAIINRNPTTGALKLSANEYPVQNPSCILIV